MPVDETRHPFRITADIEQVRVWELIEARVTLALECVACHRHTTWPPNLLQKRLAKDTGKRLIAVAGRIRCAACRSSFVLLSRHAASGAPPKVDPASKRGFTDANLDANARGRR